MSFDELGGRRSAQAVDVEVSGRGPDFRDGVEMEDYQMTA
jgi:hypothetical protein